MANVEDRQSCHQKAALLQLLHLARLGAHYHELDIALPTAGSKTGRTIRKPALLTVRPASEREQANIVSGQRVVAWISHCGHGKEEILERPGRKREKADL